MKHKLPLLAAVILLCLNGRASAQTFSRELGERTIKSIVTRVTNQVISQSSRRIQVDESYINRAVSLLGAVETDFRGSLVPKKLEELYRPFARHVVEFTAEQTIFGVVRLNRAALDRYMRQNRRCGEAPCNMNCNSCDKKCNTCKRLN